MYNDEKVGAVIVAAGDSRRMGGVDKMWALLAGKPVLFWVLPTFQNSTVIDEIVVVIKKDNLDLCQHKIKEQRTMGALKVCSGGQKRQDSVLSGLNQLEKCKWVVIHDGARPLVNKSLIEQGLEAAQETGAAIAAVPVTDTIKEATKERFVKRTLDRHQLWAVQTPQVFRYDIITEAHHRAIHEVTDDSALVEKIGYKVQIYPGSYDNIKITTPDDLVLAECLIKERFRY